MARLAEAISFCITETFRVAMRPGDTPVPIPTQGPYLMKNGRYGYRMGNAALVDAMVNDALWDVFNDYHMGITAENVAEKWGLTREMLDAFAVQSQTRACAARESGRFGDEIVPIEVKKKKETVVIDTDEGPRPGTTLEGLARLKPAFKQGGVVTAGNASSINDGAAAVVVMSEEKARELGVKPMATWVAGAMAGSTPLLWASDRLRPPKRSWPGQV